MRMTPERIIEKYWQKIFDELIKIHEDDFCELSVEYQTINDGKTIRISWKDREKRLREENLIDSNEIKERR